ncbi:hypothetical protein BDD43_5627 [Mucilaginibacter gracilis]|uniref:Uncharacterized protein n=1 Tax=Mucilaginibacter gracilis TaxID=423350 RepID=A0A495JA51_9SPHI|nr:hypothetical protein [Mucilaginibacter gracilis]RKR85358.1 hypothetical protein BDD43_5627 [Mucilaginibacter gracilis]
MENQNIEDELVSIRSLMERSSKFISLSGLSGIMAGIYALIGSALAYHTVYSRTGFFSSRDFVVADIDTHLNTLIHLLIIAAAVLLLSVCTGIFLSVKKAKRKGQSVWTTTTRSLLFHSAIPLVTGGLFMMILMNRGYYMIVAPASLIFYGLAVISGSHYTFTDVKYLGILQIILGLIAALYPGYGLIFWALGFGVLHIVYGSIMYFKYDR